VDLAPFTGIQGERSPLAAGLRSDHGGLSDSFPQAEAAR